MPSRLLVTWVVVLVGASSCGKVTATSDGGGGKGGGGGGAAGSAGAGGGAGGGGGALADGGGDDGASRACGSETCGPLQLCVHPCCGGTAPPCMARPDSGVCPSGFMPITQCSGISGPACQMAPCTPPPPHCIDRPLTCPVPATCGCLPSGTCSPNGTCGTVQMRDVSCLCA